MAARCVCRVLCVLQLKSATTLLQQLQSEHADVTKLLIDAKVEIAEKKGTAEA